MSLVPFDDRDGWIWLDGQFVPWREATVHVLTHGLHYASAVFEGERMYGGEIWELTAHTERLFKSAEILDFEIPFTVAQIDQACGGPSTRLPGGLVAKTCTAGVGNVIILRSITPIHAGAPRYIVDLNVP